MTIKTYSRARAAKAAFEKATSAIIGIKEAAPVEIEEGRYTVEAIIASGAGNETLDAIEAKGFMASFEEITLEETEVENVADADEADIAQKIEEDNKEEAEQPKKSKSGYICGTSSIGGACAMVHAIADRMFAENPATRRKDVIEACMAAGVTYGTARTQFQKWKENRG